MISRRKYMGAIALLIVSCQDKAPSRGPVQSAALATTAATHGPERTAPPESVIPSSEAVPSATASATVQASKLQILEVRQEGDLLPLVRAQRVKAMEQGRTLVVYVGAAWCPPCKRFHDAVTGGELDTALAKTTILWFDLDKDQDRLLQAGYGSKFIPFFVLPGPDGRKADSLEIKTLKKEEAMALMRDGLMKWQK